MTITNHLLFFNKKVHMVGLSERLIEKLKFILKPTLVRKTSLQTNEWLNNINPNYITICPQPLLVMDYSRKIQLCNFILRHSNNIYHPPQNVKWNCSRNILILVYFTQIWLISDYTSFQNNHYSEGNLYFFFFWKGKLNFKSPSEFYVPIITQSTLNRCHQVCKE